MQQSPAGAEIRERIWGLKCVRATGLSSEYSNFLLTARQLPCCRLFASRIRIDASTILRMEIQFECVTSISFFDIQMHHFLLSVFTQRFPMFPFATGFNQKYLNETTIPARVESARGCSFLLLGLQHLVQVLTAALRSKKSAKLHIKFLN